MLVAMPLAISDALHGTIGLILVFFIILPLIAQGLIAFAVAQQLGLPAEPLILAVLFGCNLCYATPIAYQTNMLIMSEGSYEFADYIRTGLPLVLLMVTTLSFLLARTYGM